MHVAVIASMKRGLEHFVYRELVAFSAQGFRISLLPTKLQTGLYNARPEWALNPTVVEGTERPDSSVESACRLSPTARANSD